jgi:hypothetical protein
MRHETETLRQKRALALAAQDESYRRAVDRATTIRYLRANAPYIAGMLKRREEYLAAQRKRARSDA